MCRRRQSSDRVSGGIGSPVPTYKEKEWSGTYPQPNKVCENRLEVVDFIGTSSFEVLRE